MFTQEYLNYLWDCVKEDTTTYYVNGKQYHFDTKTRKMIENKEPSVIYTDFG